jgi:hypothetical protein
MDVPMAMTAAGFVIRIWRLGSSRAGEGKKVGPKFGPKLVDTRRHSLERGVIAVR